MDEPDATQGPEGALADAASAVQADEDRDLVEDAVGLLHAERSRVRLLDRWAAAADRGTAVRLVLDGGTDVHGVVLGAGDALVELDCGVHLGHGGIVRVSGLPWVLAEFEESPASRPVRAPTWGRVLRDALAAGALCRIALMGAPDVTGYLDAVGRDHADLRLVDGDCWTVPFDRICACMRI